MRKAWKAVFRENKYTVKFYRYLLIITAITIGMIFSDELFGYFVFDDIVRAGDVLYCNQRAQTDGFAEQNGRDAERADLTCRY